MPDGPLSRAPQPPQPASRVSDDVLCRSLDVPDASLPAMQFMDRQLVIKLVESAVILAIGFGLFFGMRGRILKFAHRANLPRLTLTPVRATLRYAILIVTAVVLLGRWGFQTDTLIGVVGTMLGLVAIGFVAVWSVLSNVLCTFVLIVMRPFGVGDEIELVASGLKGRVIDLNVLYTTLEVAPNETVLVPNNTFFQAPFKRRMGNMAIGLDHQFAQSQPAKIATKQPGV